MVPAIARNLEIVSELESADDEIYRKYIRG